MELKKQKFPLDGFSDCHPRARYQAPSYFYAKAGWKANSRMEYQPKGKWKEVPRK